MNSSLDTLRDRKTGSAGFRAAARTVGAALTQDAKALFEKRGIAPERVSFVIILRAGIALLEQALVVFPNAPVGVLGMKRDPKTLSPRRYYENLPRFSGESIVVILDPMLATGGSSAAAVERIIRSGANWQNIYFIGVVGAPEGLELLTQKIPKENILLAAIDRGLDKKGMIVPGVGDFGDRYFG